MKPTCQATAELDDVIKRYNQQHPDAQANPSLNDVIFVLTKLAFELAPAHASDKGLASLVQDMRRCLFHRLGLTAADGSDGSSGN